MAATPWANIADVLELTGVTVDAFGLRQAVTSLETVTGLIQDVERTTISEADRYWLKVATCYQAAWIAAQPDYLERNDVTGASQDGQSAQGKPDWLVLAPLARRALKRLSWRGVRTVSSQPARDVVNINSDEYEDTLDWNTV